MPFDAGMLACCAREIRLTMVGGRVDRVTQPERDEIELRIRAGEGTRRMLIHAGASPRVSLSELPRENPAEPPMFCMLLRKHLCGGILTGVEQPAFDRVLSLAFDTRDALGCSGRRRLIVEVLGRYANVILTDGDGRIVSALRSVDVTASSGRPILKGVPYTPPPLPDGEDPLAVSEERFRALYAAAPPDLPADRFLRRGFYGLSPAVAREIAFTAAGRLDAPLSEVPAADLFRALEAVARRVRDGDFAPSLVTDGVRPADFSFLPLTYFGEPFRNTAYDSPGRLLDDFFGAREREVHMRRSASDILRLLSNAENRIRRKLTAQEEELRDSQKADDMRRAGDLITANLWRLERGMGRVELTDYGAPDEATGGYGTRAVELDERLTPSANAQRYYRKYAKLRNAQGELTRQMERGREELAYLETVSEALARAENAADLEGIREELGRAGYASRLKPPSASRRRSAPPPAAEFRTSGGFRVLCGKNNLQNERITHALAGKEDWWFHAKGVPGSHVVLFADGREPLEADLTEAAEIAAHFSGASGGSGIPVDYLPARYVRKVAGARPGFVVYRAHRTAYVTPDPEGIAARRIR